MRYTELFEYSREVTAQKLGPALLQKFRKEPQQWQHRVTGAATDYDDHALQYLLELIEKSDPTKNKQYVPWIVRMYVNTPSLKFEDAVSKVTEPLKKFFQLTNKKQIPAPNNDIGRIKDLAGLVQIVDQHPDVEDKPKNVDRGQAKAYHEDQDIRVIVPEDETAACYYGQGTKWCTAGREHNMFDSYNKQGEMYIVIPKKPAYTGEKYQFHFQTKQFMDEKDHRVDMSALRGRFPQLATIFAKQAKQNNVLSLDPEISDLPAMMQKVMPRFQSILAGAINQQAKSRAKEIYVELGRAVRVFKNLEEIWELAEDMLDQDGIRSLSTAISRAIYDDPEVADNEDQLYDVIGEPIIEFVRDSELWIYAMEVLEELEDEEAEFDVAMTIEGELQAMLQALIPEVFAEAIEEVKRLGS
jgi:hypothetical protein